MRVYGMTARATTGRGCRSNASEALSRMLLNTPPGWTLCGITGLFVLLHPRLAFVAAAIDCCVREKFRNFIARCAETAPDMHLRGDW